MAQIMGHIFLGISDTLTGYCLKDRKLRRFATIESVKAEERH